MNKVILTDCDGVLLDWNNAFIEWMKQRGFNPMYNANKHYDVSRKFGIQKSVAKQQVDIFNQSAWMGYLEAFRDSVYYVKKLHEKHGYKFHVITSMHNDSYAGRLREMNLKNVFGENTFERFTILGCGDDKDKALSEYRGTNYFWIEDKPENCDAGTKQGLRSLLIEHDHNADHWHGDTLTVRTWKEIYDMVIASE
jgi:beta-phosphoglucomutase-like phosphatase (HAD superfamily)